MGNGCCTATSGKDAAEALAALAGRLRRAAELLEGVAGELGTAPAVASRKDLTPGLRSASVQIAGGLEFLAALRGEMHCCG